MTVSSCPVPLDQRPVNEYKCLKESLFFGWSSASTQTFLTRLGILWVIAWIVVEPIAASGYAPTEELGKFLLAGSGGSLFLLSLIFARLYLGWAYVNRRLYSKTVDYEETGWYDGQSWTKPDEDLTQDRLISTYEVQPIIQRLKYSFGVLSLLCVAGSGLWNLF
jgi:Conserved in the green lineage and diatoms 27